MAVRFAKYQPPHLAALTHKEQLELLKAIADQKLLVFTKLLLLSGLRTGEALALTPEDFKKKGIRITKALNKATGDILSPKTKASVRTVPYNESLIELLKPYMIDNTRIFEFKSDYIVKTYKEISINTEIKFTAHILRHTFITNAYEIDVPPHIVQRWAGHAKAEEADTYLDLRQSKDYIETDIIKYMLELKNKFVPKL